MADDAVASSKPSQSSAAIVSRDESRLDLRLRGQGTTTRIVVIGGGYAGSKAAMKLSKEFPSYEIVMIDSKDYFENTIAVLTCLTHVDINSSVNAALKIVMRHDHYLTGNVRIVKEMVKEVTPTKVLLSSETIYYDYLVLACGTSYRSSIKTPHLTTDFRVQSLSRDAADLAAADFILIVGGGLVGVELAGEIIHKYPTKQITIATSGDRLLERMKSNVSNAAYKWLTSRGVTVLFGERVEQSKNKPTVFKLPKSGQRLEPSKAYWCTGFVPNSGLLEKHFESALGPRGFVKVNSFLQMEGSENVFVVGDLADLNEEKMAERAWAHASFVVKTIKALKKGEPLKKAYKSPKKPPLMVVSLGPDTSLLCTNRSLTTQGSVAASVKRWSFRTMMVKQAKSGSQTSALSPRLRNLDTRLSLNFTEQGTHLHRKVAIVGHFNRIMADVATLLAQLGAEVNVLTSSDTDKNIADQLSEKAPEHIKSHQANPKVPNTITSSLRGIHTVLFPYEFATVDPLELLQPYFVHLKSLAEAGSLKSLVVVHPGYLLEKAPKKSILGNKLRDLEEAVRSISPELTVTIVRHAPVFESFNLTASSVAEAENRTFKFPIPHQGIPFISGEDIRDSVVKIMFSAPEDHENQTYSLCGDTRITGEMVAAALSPEVGSEVKFETIPASQLIGALTRLTNAKVAPMYVDWLAHPKHLTKASEDLETVLGKPSIPLQDWVQLNTHMFV